jgi:hypothetical protein
VGGAHKRLYGNRLTEVLWKHGRICVMGASTLQLGNAHLIAAAPELYEALERVCDTYGFDSSTDSSIWQEAFAALAKARGEQVSA